ncbi:MAG: hypothetical protein Q8O00_02255 [Holophaga sp.]|nr:hypothetical protein [Holophaga sp.]
MRILNLLFLATCVLQAAPPTTLANATTQVLEAYDVGQSIEPLPIVKQKDRRALEWLQACLSDAIPRNPFLKGSRFYKEAEALRALLQSSPADFDSLLGTFKPTLAGSHAALWRWGQAHSRQGTFMVLQRHQWENILLNSSGPSTISGLALRHSLCFALAEGDETRLATLKANIGDELPNFFQPFQRAFALLGGPAPRLYLWALPELEARDLSLSRIGPRIYISPIDLPAPTDATWVVPALATNLSSDQSSLEGDNLKEATEVAEQMRSLGRKGFYAPSRAPLEALALFYFPIDIRLDAAGMITSIRMGDAAYAKPTP